MFVSIWTVIFLKIDLNFFLSYAKRVEMYSEKNLF